MTWQERVNAINEVDKELVDLAARIRGLTDHADDEEPLHDAMALLNSAALVLLWRRDAILAEDESRQRCWG